MERESFEDPETAAFMNEHFVNVKVDREERPDVDAIYMEAVQAITGQGGWPMTVFLDPDGALLRRHLLPARRGRGMPSFRMVLEAVVDAFERQREEIARAGAARRASGSARSAAIEPARGRARGGAARRGGRAPARRRRPASAAASAARPSSRPPRRWSCCWRPAAGDDDAPTRRRGHARRDDGPAASTTSSAAASPATRSTRWLVPHFEKMLYDNALLARAYLHGWQALGQSATGASARRRSTGCCARCAAPRAASTRRSTPTPRARRAVLRLDPGRVAQVARASDGRGR